MRLKTRTCLINIMGWTAMALLVAGALLMMTWEGKGR